MEILSPQYTPSEPSTVGNNAAVHLHELHCFCILLKIDNKDISTTNNWFESSCFKLFWKANSLVTQGFIKASNSNSVSFNI